MLLLLAQHRSQSTPFYAGLMLHPTPSAIIDGPVAHQSRLPIPAFTGRAGETGKPIRIELTTSADAPPTVIYAFLNYENEYSTGYGLYDDVVVRFYEDDAATIPYSVSGLTVNYRVIGWDSSSGSYDFTSSMTAYGTYLTIATNIEHDYDDGVSQRYRDYHLQPGDYVGQSLTNQ